MKLLFLIACLLPFLSFSQKANNDAGFVIEGEMDGLADNSLVYLTGFSESDTLAKSKVVNNKFTLKGKVNETDSRIINFPDIKKRLVLFMGNDRVKISGDGKNFTNIKITGSPVNYDYEEFLYHIKPLSDYITYYNNQLQSAADKHSKDSILIMLNTVYNIYERSIDDFLARKNTSPVAALLLAFSYDVDPDKNVNLLEKRFNMLKGDALKNQFAQNVKMLIEEGKIGAVGSQAMDFKQTDTAEKLVSLSEFKGKYVLLDFWASWCRPCRLENPNVVQAYNQFKNKGFTILSVSLDQEKDKWLAAIAADNLNWTHVSDLKFWNNAVALMYRIKSIPQNFLIDPNGIIIAKNLRGDELVQKLTQILK